MESAMQRSSRTVLRIGDWRVDPVSGVMARNGEPARMELRTMRLLECLAEHAGETVSIDELLNRVWPEVTVSPDSVYQAVATLRRTLGDDPKNPVYIATVPRLGYRLVAPVSPWEKEAADVTMPEAISAGPAAQAAAHDSTGRRPRWGLLWAGCGVILVLLLGGFALRGRIANRRPILAPAQGAKAVAVLPFLDLTEGMRNEEFADGMTEELIDKLSKVAGLRVPSATSSFYFKNKRVPLGDIAKGLGVGYVVDGSVRKSGRRLRVAARLVRVDNGYVMWTETYDQPMDDLLMVQDDIAGDVTKALTQSIEGQQ
jgi:TolB-like protein/DNA-binding winged helix-turn-helix (wHTH) protein